MTSEVYFTKNLTSEALVKIFEAVEKNLKGNVCVKVHSGEKGNQNFLRPEFFVDIINHVGGTVVECNTAYDGARNTTAKHKELIKEHGWTKYFKVDLLDAEGPDIVLTNKNGKTIKNNYIGKNTDKYNSMLVLSHFKGHPMGGYGGAIKQLSIGCTSSYGKAYIHGAGDPEKIWTADHNAFLSSMADSAKMVVDYFDGNIVYINVMTNMSVDCDCCAKAEDPCLKDIGILTSTDPVAIDRACIDLVKQSGYRGVQHFMERVTSRNGEYTIECAKQQDLGSTNYKLINID